MNNSPRFKVDKSTRPPKLALHCSKCDKFIREITPKETIDVTRGYFCLDCGADGRVIPLNPPVKTGS